ncbi:MAG: hypothetical protein A3J46_05840 [Candidatus Yanofskybacteria bacterium RIFCSPHIGHO2_02_FULL_41_11]|uniref:Uncharacterized protein n=1 Tax=Candidatus Yanofskybacteria bacterium RIFCSPHIGHO2_02_FULL_41_11 TaxID=1802675 RepID=A0A1F8F860_9BACT|nr:MAG: hypothetical protein A3J46_05840 [Candidatus Yanofskybacteria bacterium RIFCSPHIGHO2_02_FULL_41_11]
MNKILAVVIFAFFALGPLAAAVGDIQILKRQREEFLNENCQVGSTCDLKRIDYLVEDYRVELQEGPNYGTRMYAKYETDNVESLTEYVFVQFIKGCMFTSRVVGNQIINSLDIGRYLYRNSEKEPAVIFKHPDWEIDSPDRDPVYYSISGSDRHSNYRWNTEPNSFLDETEKYFGQEIPEEPKLYIRDRPGTAFYARDKAINVSLYFRLCLYKAKDVPVEPGIINTKPIHCFRWESSFVYDHEAGKFEYPYEIAPVCKSP